MEYIYTIQTTEGIHARIAQALVRGAQKFPCEIYLQYKDKTVDAKSILGLMSLAVPEGKNVKLIVKGKMADQAIKVITKEITSFNLYEI